MRTMISLCGCAALALLFCTLGQANEKKIALDKVPKPVLDAAKARFENAKFTGAEEENEDGKKIYEIALQYKGSKYEAEFTPEGKLIGFDRFIAKGDLPKPVDEALQSKYPESTYKAIEEVTKVDGDQEKVDGYEVLIVTKDNKKYEVVVSPDGKIKKEEDKNKKKDDD